MLWLQAIFYLVQLKIAQQISQQLHLQSLILFFFQIVTSFVLVIRFMYSVKSSLHKAAQSYKGTYSQDLFFH